MAEETKRLEETTLFPSVETNRWLKGFGSAGITQPVSLALLLRRPELSYEAIAASSGGSVLLPPDVRMQIEVSVKYAGYVKRQQDAIDRFKRLEGAVIPQDLDYTAVTGLSREAREKLTDVRPHSLGQAARVPGVTPAALSLLSVHLKRHGSY